MADSNDYVVFELPDGTEISNDPRWKAEKTLRDSGVEAGSTSAEVQAQLDAANQEIEALKAALAAREAEESLEDEDEPTGNYSDVKGKALTALAKERGIVLKNEDGTTKTAGDVRAELIAQDAAK